MPLQNRADPFGRLHAVAARGLFTGNRGVIHDPATKTLLGRGWTTKSWIVCALAHPRGRRREPMGRNAPSGGAGWTELFFLDEVTALAAGHRPCFYCRRAEALSFQHGFADHRASAPEMDAALHRERLAPKPILGAGEIEDLPDGAMIAVENRACAVRGGATLPWSFSGYGEAENLPEAALLLTPPSSVAALRAGFQPVWAQDTKQWTS